MTTGRINQVTNFSTIRVSYCSEPVSLRRLEREVSLRCWSSTHKEGFYASLTRTARYFPSPLITELPLLMVLVYIFRFSPLNWPQLREDLIAESKAHEIPKYKLRQRTRDKSHNNRQVTFRHRHNPPCDELHKHRDCQGLLREHEKAD